MVFVMVIVINVGVDGLVVVEKMREFEWRSGYNVMFGRYEDFINVGIVDFCKVLRFVF